jgi:putative membrane protein
MNDTGRAILIAVLVLIALPLLWGVVMMGTGGGMMGGFGPGMMGGWGAEGRWEPWRVLVGLIPMLVVLGSIAALVTWAVGRSAPAAPLAGQLSARDLLDARYARGEVTREQYQQMRDDLKT